MSSSARVLVALLLVMVGTSACSEPSKDIRYVALGDSAVAGAGIESNHPGVCQRSDHNYPSLLASALDVEKFIDNSCPGATTSDVLNETTHPTGAQLPAQIKAVTRDTDIVTISIGGNDDRVIPDLFLSCYVPPKNTPAACQAAIRRIPALLTDVETNIVEVLRAIKKKAPDALVVLVSYLRLMPDSGTCDSVPIAPDDLKAAAATEGKVEATMRAAAEQADVKYVSMRSRSAGHDACAPVDKAWVSALAPQPGDGTFLHPRAVGMQAVADAVAPMLKRRFD